MGSEMCIRDSYITYYFVCQTIIDFLVELLYINIVVYAAYKCIEITGIFWLRYGICLRKDEEY